MQPPARWIWKRPCTERTKGIYTGFAAKSGGATCAEVGRLPATRQAESAMKPSHFVGWPCTKRSDDASCWRLFRQRVAGLAGHHRQPVQPELRGAQTRHRAGQMPEDWRALQDPRAGALGYKINGGNLQ